MREMSGNERVTQLVDITMKKSSCSLDYLSSKMGVSTRTVRNCIKQINGEFVGIAELVKENANGYRWNVQNNRLFTRLVEEMRSRESMLDSPERRLACIIDKLINSDYTVTLDDLAFDMNIGRTTLVNELKKVNIVLKPYNLCIHGRQGKGLYLEGDELNIRLFILENVYEYLYGSYPLDKDIEDEVARILCEHGLESDTQTLLLHTVVLMLDRILNNHPIMEICSKHKKLLHTNDYQIALQVVRMIETKLPLAIRAPEKVFITLPIAGRRTPTNDRALGDIPNTEHVEELLKLILEQVGLYGKISSASSGLFRDLRYHLSLMLNRIMFGIPSKNPLLDEMKEKYPVAYKMAEIAGDVIQSEYGIRVPESELGFLASYFCVFNAQSEDRFRNVRKVAVICGTGRGTAKLMSLQLQRILSSSTKIDLYSDIDVDRELLSSYDIVFSSVKLSFAIETPFIMLNEIFDEKSVCRRMERMIYLQKLKIRNKENCKSIIDLLTNEGRYFVLDCSLGYYENINSMVDKLTNAGYLDDEFKQRLIMREEKGSMAFGQFISVPHTFNYAVNQIVLAVGVSNQGILNNGKRIKLVFLLGIPKQSDDNAGLLVKIYDEIIGISVNDELVEYLAGTTQYENFSRCLEQIVP